MGFNTDNYHQVVTYWTATGRDAYGNQGFGTPVTTKARWEQRTFLVRDASGREVASSARVWIDETLSEEDFLFLGTSVAATPPEAARQVLARQLIPDVDGVHEVQAVMLR